MDRIVFHIDVNSAYLSWEAVARLKAGETVDLREIPAAVGGDIETRHGVILAKSIPAKKYGVTTGEPVVDALRKCPDLTLVKPHHQMYREQSRAFIAILQQYSDVIEQFSVDEAFVDMTGSGRLFGTPVEAAHRIRKQIYEELGFTVNIGVSSNKLLAKMASDFQKPDRVHTLFPEEIEQKMWILPVRDLFFVGKAAERRLRSLGIRTIGDLAHTDPQVLSRVLKKHGEVLWRYANGIDDSPVEIEPADAKGYSNSTTLSFDVTSGADAKSVLRRLTDQVCQRIRQDDVRVETVTVQIRFNDLTRHRISVHFRQRPILRKKFLIPCASCLMKCGMAHPFACWAFQPQKYPEKIWDGRCRCLMIRIMPSWRNWTKRWIQSGCVSVPEQCSGRRI